VTAVDTGRTIVTATSLADTSVIGTVVVSVFVLNLTPPITIATINHNGVAVDLTNAFGTLDVVVNVDRSSPLVSRADVVMNSAGTDTVVATYRPGSTAAAPGPITLSFNTIGLRNGPWTLKVRVTLMSGAVDVSSTVVVVINNQ
jgi:hypothetical protein